MPEMIPPIEVKVGDQFTVFTSANPTTGYLVALKNFPECVYLIGRDYVPDHPQIIGSGGKTNLRFIAMKTGEGAIELRHVRPWGNPPEEASEFPQMLHQLDHWFVRVS